MADLLTTIAVRVACGQTNHTNACPYPVCGCAKPLEDYADAVGVALDTFNAGKGRPSAEVVLPLADMVADVRREIGMRERVYPGWVAKGTLRKADADRQLDRMRSVLATLLWLQANQQAVQISTGTLL